MATYKHTVKFSNGQVLRVWYPTTAPVGGDLPVEINGEVTATSQVTFKLDSDAVIIDNYTDNTAGMHEFIADDKPTGRYLVSDASMAATNTARVNIPLKLRGGVSYKLRTRAVGAA